MMQSARRPTIVQLASLAIEHKVPGTMPHRHQPSRFLSTSLLITQGKKARGVAREWSAEPSNHQPFHSPEKWPKLIRRVQALPGGKRNTWKANMNYATGQARLSLLCVWTSFLMGFTFMRNHREILMQELSYRTPLDKS